MENSHFDFGQPLNFLISEVINSNLNCDSSSLKKLEHNTTIEGCGQHFPQPQRCFALLNLKGFNG